MMDPAHYLAEYDLGDGAIAVAGLDGARADVESIAAGSRLRDREQRRVERRRSASRR